MKKQMIGLVMIAFAWGVQTEAAEVTWQKDIKPIFDKQCASCHSTGSPEHDEFSKDKKKWIDKSIGMRMDSYSLLVSYVGWPQTGALIRRLDDGSGKADKKAGNMYEHLGDTEAMRKANLDTFKAWVGNWNPKRWKDITKDELNALKIKY
ncbi:MAG: cytochrome C [Deltaproteobacteria bacterium]|nr:cytochrome C [Deltaproteobacteria bacterium]